MELLRISGGKKLFGEVFLPTAKNSVLPMMAAALLCDTPSRFLPVPDLLDVQTSLSVIRALGAQGEYENGVLTVRPAPLTGRVPAQLSAAMRSSVYYLAPMLHHTGHAFLPFPGGCQLGKRPIDLHLSGLEAMGATIAIAEDGIHCDAPAGLHGTNFCFSLPSVGATETMMLAAAQAKGTTVLCGCAKEPEIADLARFLNRCGANITGAGGCCITIHGVKSLSGARHTPIPDRITAATVLCAVAACGGEVVLHRVCYPHLLATVHLLEQAGAVFFRPTAQTLRMTVSRPLSGVWAKTGVYPAFATDAGPLLAAAMLSATGESRIEETIFENRFACAEEFQKLGAQIAVEGGTLKIAGKKPLSGAPMTARDLRGGAAIVIAALAAQGESQIAGVEYIRRGYEDIAALLAPLGALIETQM